MTLAAKYTKLKKQIGGNREQFHYEETFGMPREEAARVTMPNKDIRRILAETEFAIRLSEEKEHKFDSIVEEALDYMLSVVAEEGVLTKSACYKAEEILMPLKDAAKEYSLILAGHAHIDMNWMWSWHETVASTIATFQTMLKLMDEYPEFCFSQSQASVYEIIEKYAPELKPLIEERIREGRWEITASQWVETDKNMPSSESLYNHMYFTKKYLKEHWGVSPADLEIDFSPDTFGHSRNIPEIDALGNVKYMYHCRGLDGDNAVYRWKSASGKELLVCREQYWYNGAVTPKQAIGIFDVAKRSGGLKTQLAVYGVGDHGGGPTRRDVERAIDMMSWPIYPNIKFGTFREFFKEAEKVRDKLPIVDKEMNYFARGCYTTQSRLKMGNRRTEAALFDAQIWHTFSGAKDNFTEAQFEKAWQNVLFTHFHDILTGSCVQDSREHSMGLFTDSMAIANSRSSLAMQRIAADIDTSMFEVEEIFDSQSDGAGVGYGVENFVGVPSPERGVGIQRIYHIYNSATTKVKRNCEITVWDWVGDMRDIVIKLADGTEVPYQLIDHDYQQYWDHKYFRLLVEVEVPELGYTTVMLDVKEPEEYRVYFQPEIRSAHAFVNPVLENEYLRAEFDLQNGELISLIDKKDGKEKIRAGESGGLRYVITERRTSSAWDIGKYIKISDPLLTKLVRNNKGELESSLYLEQAVENSKAEVKISLEKNSKALKIDLKVTWNESSAEQGQDVPVLVYRLPLVETETYLNDVPGGSMYREAQHGDIPGQQYCAAIIEDRAVAIVSDCKYGYRGYKNDLICTLINASYSPDPYPERGIHTIKLHVLLDANCPKLLEDDAFSLNHPLLYQSGKKRNGKLAPTASFMQCDLGTAVIAGISQIDGDMTVRLFETNGKDTKVTLAPMFEVKEVYFTDIMGEKRCGDIALEDNKIAFDLKANNSVMIRIIK